MGIADKTDLTKVALPAEESHFPFQVLILDLILSTKLSHNFEGLQPLSRGMLRYLQGRVPSLISSTLR